MTTGLIEQKANGAALATISGETLHKLVIGGDLSRLDEQQKMEYYVYRCKVAGLDPATKPFDLLKLSGKEVLYATKECSSQISNRDDLSATVVSDGVVGDIYRVVARCKSPSGRETDDMGCVPIKGLTGDALCNAMMKATTKAKRRAILTHAGLGMLDESEIETIPKAVQATVVKTSPVSGEQTEPLIVPDVERPVDGNPETPVIAESDSPDLKKMVGKVLRVSERSGKKGDKPWTRYGVEVESEELGKVWLNTFSMTLGSVSKEVAGTVQSILYSVGEYNGQTQYNLEGYER